MDEMEWYTQPMVGEQLGSMGPTYLRSFRDNCIVPLFESLCIVNGIVLNSRSSCERTKDQCIEISGQRQYCTFVTNR